MADYTNWWDAPNSAAAISPYTGQPDYLSGLSASPAINTAVNTTAGFGAAGGNSNGIMDWLNNSGIFGSTGADGTKMQGWGTPALSLLSGLGSAYFGAQQLSLAKDSLQAQKDQFAQNFTAQRKTTNAALADRQNARVASNPGAYSSVSDYMSKYGV